MNKIAEQSKYKPRIIDKTVPNALQELLGL